jgi:hypothetical protein
MPALIDLSEPTPSRAVAATGLELLRPSLSQICDISERHSNDLVHDHVSAEPTTCPDSVRLMVVLSLPTLGPVHGPRLILSAALKINTLSSVEHVYHVGFTLGTNTRNENRPPMDIVAAVSGPYRMGLAVEVLTVMRDMVA